MESALTPREIQARIRGGESLEEVAQAAGVSVEQIDAYAGPVLAEREHAATLARTSQVRRHRESGVQRLLGEVVADALAAEGVAPEEIRWDSWRDENRRWTVQVSWPSNGEQQHADFDFDQRGRYSTAKDAGAKKLIGERPPQAKRPGTPNPDAEPTVDLHDELAIVRVVQDNAEPPAVLPDVPAARIIKLPGRDQDNIDDEPDDYVDPELEQFDGVYDIVSNPRSDMDVLYDMLSGFNEDSVRIYTGLTQPVSPPPDPEPEAQPRSAQRPRPSDPRSRRRGRTASVAGGPIEVAPAADQPAEPDKQPTDAETAQSAATPPESAAAPDSRGGAHPKAATPRAKATHKPATPRPKPAQAAAHAEQASAEPEQDALVSGPEEQTTPKPRKRRKRASVPTWDEIMFGAPPPSDPSN